jgi:hypothetical protein
MSKQKITVELEVPDGWEATGEVRPRVGDEAGLAWNYLTGCWFAGTAEQCSDRLDRPVIILRRKDPPAIQALRGFIEALEWPLSPRFAVPLKIAKDALSDYERGVK